LKDIFHQIAEKWGFEILALEIMPNHIHLFVSVQNMLLHKDIQGGIFKLGKRHPECKEGSELWTRSYFVATAGNVRRSNGIH